MRQKLHRLSERKGENCNLIKIVNIFLPHLAEEAGGICEIVLRLRFSAHSYSLYFGTVISLSAAANGRAQEIGAITEKP